MFIFPIRDRVINNNALVSTSKGLYYTSDGLLDDTYVFTIDIIDLFDKVVIKNNINLCTLEQKELFKDYLDEKDSDLLSQFDEYLGGYLGDTDSIYFYTHLREPNTEISLSKREDINE